MNNALRQLFPITRHYIYLNHAAVAPLPQPSADAMHRLIEEVAQTGSVRWSAWMAEVEHTRAKVACLVTARPEEIAFLGNTSEGISAIANGLSWQPGDNVVTCASEFPANVYPWMRLARYGVQVRMAPERDGRIDVEELLALVDDRTRVIAVSYVQFASGFRMDLERLGDFCRRRGIFFFVDAIQGLGVHPFDVRRYRIDAFAADGHKWLLGPESAAVLFLAEHAWEKVRPTVVGWMSVKNWDRVLSSETLSYRLDYHDSARRFEYGTLNAVGLAGLGASLDLLLAVGIETIDRHVLDLGTFVCQAAQSKGYRVVSSRRPGEASAIVCLVHPRIPAEDVVRRLEKERIIVSARCGRVRIAPHLYNTREDMEALIAALPTH